MLETLHQHCPYCGEPINLLVDTSGGDQDYIEDCSVCCQPICVQLCCEPLSVLLRHQNEA